LIAKIAAVAREKRLEIVRFAKFLVVGTIGTAIDFGLFNLFHNVLGLHAALANTMSITASIVNNYTWSRFWVYPETKNHQGRKKFVQFVVVSMIAWALNTSILWSTERWVLGTSGLLASFVAPVAAAIGMQHGVLSSNGAKVIATGIVLFWNFFANRFWTFRDVDAVRPDSPSSELTPADTRQAVASGEGTG
jgi:putative flippase GtrA